MIPDAASTAAAETDQDAVFVEQYVLTGDAVTACIRAGIRDARYPITVIAERTLNRPEIAAAVNALKKIGTSAQPLEVTRESIIADMEEVYQKALTDGQYASAIGSKKLQSMLLGLLQTQININHSHRVDMMTDEQLMRIAGGQARDITSAVTVVEDEDAD